MKYIYIYIYMYYSVIQENVIFAPCIQNVGFFASRLKRWPILNSCAFYVEQVVLWHKHISKLIDVFIVYAFTVNV